MLNLKKDDFKLCASLMRQPYGQALHQLFKKQLDEVNITLRMARGEQIGVEQGHALALATLIMAFEAGDEIAKKFT